MENPVVLQCAHWATTWNGCKPVNSLFRRFSLLPVNHSLGARGRALIKADLRSHADGSLCKNCGN